MKSQDVKWAAKSAVNFLTSSPTGFTTVERAVAKEVLISMNGQVTVWGTLYDIKAENLGAGAYRLSLKEWKP